ncbi:citramalate synthase [Methylococcus sp. EFPC2]|uniref:citramalate synthase n=1 Tax=Methylococcus sp. EFPC2 TaxID=2812648 RepID=UPI0019673807|nr:citramalate synthase [Methylococcus sp. EFPC2]QSA96214.1 citramalate synthase [Methylococcus sp. EFPC2]
MTQIYLYDTTLRDGSQREDISLSCDDKLAIAQRLDQMGIHYIEAGWPGSNPKDAEFFQRAGQLGLKQARVVAFGSTRRKQGRCETDKNLQALLAASTPAVTLVGKSWDFQVEKVLETSLEENLAMIGESIAYMKSHGRETIFDAEHFFDGYKANPEYALAALLQAADAGAEYVVLCDTNGGCLPWEIESIVREVQARTPCKLGIHVHNDSGCAVANSLAAVRGGCVQVQGTINGYGERVGNADLTAIIPGLQLKLGYSVVTPAQLRELTGLSRYVAEITNLQHDRFQPYVGESAFAHKGGIHAAAMLKAANSYQHIEPGVVGNVSRMVISELSGRGNVLALAGSRGLNIGEDEAKRILDHLKKLEHQGYAFEAAEASVDLLILRAGSDYKPPFELIDFMVLAEHRRGRGVLSEATVKLRVGEEVCFTAAEGNGPVNALSRALHQVLCQHYPVLQPIRLTDYKVRILNSGQGTASVTRVLTSFHDGERAWTTVGASANIIEASWQALSDSMEYALMGAQQADGRPE